MELVLYIDPHTLAVKEVLERKCTACHRHLPDEAFYVAPRGKYTKLCRRCYNNRWMSKHDRITPEQHIVEAVCRANRRSRMKRSVGEPITEQEATQLWEACQGKCTNCSTPLVWDYHPRTRNENRAVLDRVETAQNHSYHENAQWMCTVCNEEKGGWDLAVQLQHEIETLRAQCTRLRARCTRLKKRRKKQHVRSYADILIPIQKK